jgi:hypothetical protein
MPRPLKYDPASRRCEGENFSTGLFRGDLLRMKHIKSPVDMQQNRAAE